MGAKELDAGAGKLVLAAPGGLHGTDLDAGAGKLVLAAPGGLHGTDFTPPLPQRGGDGDIAAGRYLRPRHHRPAGRGAGAGDR